MILKLIVDTFVLGFGRRCDGEAFVVEVRSEKGFLYRILILNPFRVGLWTESLIFEAWQGANHPQRAKR